MVYTRAAAMRSTHFKNICAHIQYVCSYCYGDCVSCNAENIHHVPIVEGILIVKHTDWTWEV